MCVTYHGHVRHVTDYLIRISLARNFRVPLFEWLRERIHTCDMMQLYVCTSDTVCLSCVAKRKKTDHQTCTHPHAQIDRWTDTRAHQ